MEEGPYLDKSPIWSILVRDSRIGPIVPSILYAAVEVGPDLPPPFQVRTMMQHLLTPKLIDLWGLPI